MMSWPRDTWRTSWSAVEGQRRDAGRPDDVGLVLHAAPAGGAADAGTPARGTTHGPERGVHGPLGRGTGRSGDAGLPGAESRSLGDLRLRLVDAARPGPSDADRARGPAPLGRGGRG